MATHTSDGVTLRVIDDPAIIERYSRLVSAGSTGLVELLPGGARVKKAVIPWMRGHMRQDQIREMRREIEIYSHLPKRHPRLLQMLAFYDTGDDVGIELEYMPHGSLREYLAKHSAETVGGVPAVPARQRARWALEVADGVAVLHAHDVIHADVKPENMVLDDHLGVRIIDLSGSAFRGEPALCLESTRYYMPRTPQNEDRRRGCSVTTDLFAVGCSLYHIVMGAQPYDELPDDEVEARYERHEFPSLEKADLGDEKGEGGSGGDTSSRIMFADTISKCWHGQFASANAVLAALQAETRAIFGVDDLDYIEVASGIALQTPEALEAERKRRTEITNMKEDEFGSIL